MARNIHYILKSFRDRIAASDVLNAALAGGLHHGFRSDTDTPRPFGQMEVEEISRNGHSGNASFVTYTATLRIIGGQAPRVISEAQQAFSDAFDRSIDLPSVDGQVLMVWPVEPSGIVEAKEQEFGADILVGTQTWQILIQE